MSMLLVESREYIEFHENARHTKAENFSFVSSLPMSKRHFAVERLGCTTVVSVAWFREKSSISRARARARIRVSFLYVEISLVAYCHTEQFGARTLTLQLAYRISITLVITYFDLAR